MQREGSPDALNMISKKDILEKAYELNFGDVGFTTIRPILIVESGHIGFIPLIKTYGDGR